MWWNKSTACGCSNEMVEKLILIKSQHKAKQLNLQNSREETGERGWVRERESEPYNENCSKVYVPI